MAITVTELVESREVVAYTSIVFRYLVSNTEYFTEQEAIAAVEGATDETYEFAAGSAAAATLVRQAVQIEAIGDPTVSFKYKAVVNYKTTTPKGITGVGLDQLESFDTSGGTIHITQSISTVDDAGSASDYKNAIGVSNSGGNLTVDGVDIVAPIFNKTITKTLDASEMTTTYKGKLFSLTGKVNNATFNEFAAGECLFLGATGNQQSNGEWNMTYKFAASPNETGITINGLSVDKKGWEYLWVEYKDEKDLDTGKMKRVAAAVYVEQVYKTGDFSELGL